MNYQKFSDRHFVNKKMEQMERTITTNAQHQTAVLQFEAMKERINTLYIAAVQEEDLQKKKRLLDRLQSEINHAEQFAASWNQSIEHQERTNTRIWWIAVSITVSIFFPPALFGIIPLWIMVLLFSKKRT